MMWTWKAPKLSMYKCPECNGKGYLLDTYETGFIVRHLHAFRRTCFHCLGAGYIPKKYAPSKAQKNT